MALCMNCSWIQLLVTCSQVCSGRHKKIPAKTKVQVFFVVLDIRIHGSEEGGEPLHGWDLRSMLWLFIWDLSDAAWDWGSQHLKEHKIYSLSIFLFLNLIVLLLLLLLQQFCYTTCCCALLTEIWKEPCTPPSAEQRAKKKQ